MTIFCSGNVFVKSLFYAVLFLSLGCGGNSAPSLSTKNKIAQDDESLGNSNENTISKETANSSEESVETPTYTSRPAVAEDPEVWGGFEVEEVRLDRRLNVYAEPKSNVVTVLQEGHTERITALEFTSDGRLFVTTSYEDKKVKIWTKDGDLLRTLVVPGRCLDWLRLLPDGSGFWTGCLEKAFKYDYSGKMITSLEGDEYRTEAAVVSPDGKQIVTYDGLSTIAVRNEMFEPISRYSFERAKIKSIAYSPDGRYFVIGGYQIDAGNGRYAAASVRYPDGSPMAGLEVNVPNSILVTPRNSFSNTEEDDTLIDEVKWVDISKDGKTIALVGGDKRVAFWSPGGKQLGSFKKKWRGHEDLWRVHFTPDGRSLLLVLSKSIVKIGLDGKEEGGFVTVQKRTHALIGGFSVSADGSRIAVGIGYGDNDIKGSVSIYDRFGTIIRTLKMDAPYFTDVTLSPDFTNLFMQIKRGKKSIVWNAANNSIDTITETTGYYRDGTGYKFVGEAPMTIVNNKGQRTFALKSKGFVSIVPLPMPDGNMATVKGGENHKIEIFSPEGVHIRTVEYNGYGRGVGQSIAFAPDVSFFAVETATNNGGYHALECISLETGEILSNVDVKEPFEKIAVGPDSNTLAVGHKNGDITLWTRFGSLLKTLKGHTDEISALSFDMSGKYIVSASKDRTVSVWNLETGLRISVVVMNNGEWVAFDENGRFDCSSNGRELLRMVRGNTAYEPRQFWNDFFTPGLVAKSLEGKRFKAVDVAMELRKAPIVSIEITKEPLSESLDGKATLKVCAKTDGGPVGEIFLFHNGRTFDADSRGISRIKAANCEEFSVGLSPGNNTFVGAAYDETGSVFGQSNTAHLRYQPKTLKRPEMYILAVGVSNYKDKNISLIYPSEDAKAISSALRESAKSLYGAVHIETLLNEQASRVSIKKKLSEIAASAKSDDTVILYFAGHGDTEKDEYYFLSYDSDITDLSRTALAVKDLSGFAKTAAAGKIAVFLDTCKSGAAAKHIGAIAMARGIEERKIIASLAKERGIVVFSAAGNDQSAFEISKLKHGVFTYCMLDYLKNKRNDVASNDMVSIAKLLSMVSRATRELAEKHLNVEQTPILYVFGEDFSLGYL